MSEEGSWQAGVDGACRGSSCPASAGSACDTAQGTLQGNAENGAEIIYVDALAKVPAGRFDHGVQTPNFSGIEPDVVEEKIYAKGRRRRARDDRDGRV